MWALSLLDFLSWVVFDNKPTAGTELANGGGSELGKFKSKGVEARIDSSKDAVETS